MNPSFDPDLERVYPLPARGSWPESRHRFDRESIWAVRTALAAARPLLVRGEPGVGKSQLARAAAEVLEVPFLSHVVHGTSECGDLLFTFDAVARLAQAQVLGAARRTAGWRKELAESRFVRPGVLWWAFDWVSAREQSRGCGADVPEPWSPPGWTPGDGCVVLIDEIDKADSDLPNGLLESLGNLGFHVPPTAGSVSLARTARTPLVMVTTNEERELPAAFLRRCLVLHLNLPAGAEAQREFLVQRARVHFEVDRMAESVCAAAANLLWEDRETARRAGQALPGAAEYLDVLRALDGLHPGDEPAQQRALAEVRQYAFRKHPVESEP